jgi:hypothetical protein
MSVAAGGSGENQFILIEKDLGLTSTLVPEELNRQYQISKYQIPDKELHEQQYGNFVRTVW